jgi:hypothetical protein
MSEQFNPGEIAIGQNFIDFPEHNGEDLVIVEGARFGSSIDAMDLTVYTGVRYEVESIRGERFYCTPSHLRRRNPPATGEQAIRDLFLVAPEDRRATVESRAEYWAAYEYTHLMIACDVRGLAGAQP